MEEKKLVPEIRFKGYDEEWNSLPFYKIVNRSSSISFDETVPSVEYEDILSGEGRLNKDIQQKAIHKTGQRFSKGDILFGKLRPYLGNNLLADFDGIAVGDFWIFKDGLAKTDFVYPFIYSQDFDFISNISSGSKMPRSDWQLISTWNFNIPLNSDEQQKIGEYFKKLDGIIADTEKQIERLEKLKTASLQKMFPQPGESVPQIRFKGFKGEWKRTTLKDMCSDFKYGMNVPASDFDGKRKYLRITDIDDSTREFSKENLTSPMVNEISQEYRLTVGDIVFARTGASVGKTYLYTPEDEEVYWAGFLIRAKINENNDTNFIFQNTLTDTYKNFIEMTSQRSSQPGINAKEYGEFSFFVPNRDEQKAIGEYFRNLDNLIKKKKKKVTQLRNLKKASLSKMFVNTAKQ